MSFADLFKLWLVLEFALPVIVIGVSFYYFPKGTSYIIASIAIIYYMVWGTDTDSPETTAQQEKYNKEKAIEVENRKFWSLNHVCAAAGSVMVSSSKFKVTDGEDGYSETINGKNEVTCAHAHGGDDGLLVMKSVYNDLGQTTYIEEDVGQFGINTNLSRGDLAITVTCYSGNEQTYMNMNQMIKFTFKISDFDDGTVSRSEADIKIYKKSGYCLGLGPPV